MHLIQLLLPLGPNTDQSKNRFKSVLDQLTSEFGGVTAVLNSPAEGLWLGESGPERDRIVTIEVMVDDFDAAWWSRYREALEEDFAQEEIVARALQITKI